MSVSTDSFIFIPSSVEKQKRLNTSLPEPTTPTPRPKLNLTLPAPKNELNDTINDSLTTDDNSLYTSAICTDESIGTSTPQKKFKRRNESIYKTLE